MSHPVFHSHHPLYVSFSISTQSQMLPCIWGFPWYLPVTSQQILFKPLLCPFHCENRQAQAQPGGAQPCGGLGESQPLRVLRARPWPSVLSQLCSVVLLLLGGCPQAHCPVTGSDLADSIHPPSLDGDQGPHLHAGLPQTFSQGPAGNTIESQSHFNSSKLPNTRYPHHLCFTEFSSFPFIPNQIYSPACSHTSVKPTE